MKRLGISQRVEIVESYKERRDCLDQRWIGLANKIGYLPIPLPTLDPSQVPPFLDALNLDAVLLSGGNSISGFGPAQKDEAVDRDEFEASLIEESLKREIGVIGVCRGMQMINIYFEGSLSPIDGHVAIRHGLDFDRNYQDMICSEVNSYHGWAIYPSDLAKGLKAIAHDSDGNVEAFIHSEKRVGGLMWHPEREPEFHQKDQNFIQSIIS